MNDIMYLIMALVVGFIIGTIFYYGLWFTVQKGIKSTLPALWFLVSFLLRASIALIGFYYISIDHWQRLPVSLIGFLIARYVIARITKPNKENQIQINEGVQT